MQRPLFIQNRIRKAVVSMKKVISIAILLALLLSVISVYACDRIECRDIRSTQLPNGGIDYYCGCPAYGCKCAECEFCKDQFIEETSAPNAYLEPNYYPDYDAEESYVVICRRLNVRPDASTRNARVDVLPRGTTVQVLSIENGWAKIARADGSEAYVFAKHIRKV